MRLSGLERVSGHAFCTNRGPVRQSAITLLIQAVRERVRVPHRRNDPICRTQSTGVCAFDLCGIASWRDSTLTVVDVLTMSGDVCREIKLGAHQTKGSKGSTVVLSTSVRSEIDSYGKAGRLGRAEGALVASQRNGRAFSSVSLSMLFRNIYEMADIRTSSHSGRRTFATRLNASGVGMATIQKLMGHKHIGTTSLY